MQLLPRRQHIDDAGQLQHEHRHHIEGILVARIEHIHGPHINEPDVIASQHRLFVHSMEMPAEANVLFHAEHVTNDGHIVLGVQGFSFGLTAHREHHLIGCAELVGLVR